MGSLLEAHIPTKLQGKHFPCYIAQSQRQKVLERIHDVAQAKFFCPSKTENYPTHITFGLANEQIVVGACD